MSGHSISKYSGLIVVFKPPHLNMILDAEDKSDHIRRFIGVRNYTNISNVTDSIYINEDYHQSDTRAYEEVFSMVAFHHHSSAKNFIIIISSISTVTISFYDP